MLQQAIKNILGEIAGATLLPRILRHKTVIFTFHRVLSEQDYGQCHFGRSIAVTDTGLDNFLQHIKRQFRVIALSEFISTLQSQQPEPQQPQAVITFDDGWRDNFSVALPVLRQHRVPATIFLSTDFLDSTKGFWWQHLGDMLGSPDLDHGQWQAINNALQQLTGIKNAGSAGDPAGIDRLIETIKRHHYDKVPDIIAAIANITATELAPHVLSWEECRQMSAQGIEFGSHTLSHPRLSLLQDNELQAELADSKACLQARGIRYVDAICYPYGDYNGDTLKAAARHYQAGLTTDSGIITTSRAAAYRLPRINVPESIARHRGLLNYRLLKAGMKRH